MKTTELIAKLQVYVLKYGDAEITVYDDLNMNDLEIIDAIAYTSKKDYPSLNSISIRVLGLI